MVNVNLTAPRRHTPRVAPGPLTPRRPDLGAVRAVTATAPAARATCREGGRREHEVPAVGVDVAVVAGGHGGIVGGPAPVVIPCVRDGVGSGHEPRVGPPADRCCPMSRASPGTIERSQCRSSPPHTSRTARPSAPRSTAPAPPRAGARGRAWRPSHTSSKDAAVVVRRVRVGEREPGAHPLASTVGGSTITIRSESVAKGSRATKTSSPTRQVTSPAPVVHQPHDVARRQLGQCRQLLSSGPCAGGRSRSAG